MGKTKQELIVDNNQSFPNNNANYITPSLLRNFNRDMIDSTVNQDVYTADSGSFNQRIGDLASWSSSLDTNFASQTEFNSYTQSNDAKVNAIIAATASFVDSAITASSLTTASFTDGTLTFTKGDGSTFGVVIPDVSGSTIDTGSFATTGSNTFTGINTFDADINVGYVDVKDDGGFFLRASGSNVVPGVGEFWSLSSQFQVGDMVFVQQPSNDKVMSLGLDDRYVTFYKGIDLEPGFDGMDVRQSGLTISSSFGGKTDLLNVKGDISASNLNLSGALTASILEGYALVGGAGNVSTLVPTSSFGGGGSTDTGSLLVTASANLNTITFTKGDASTFDVTIDTGSAAGGQTFERPSLISVSGSLGIVANTFTSGAANFAHITASADNQVNIVFKNNNNTANTIVSGSGNIYTNQGVATGFKRYMTAGNLALSTAAVPAISASMDWSPTISNNIFSVTNAPLIWRGPVSASASTFSNNVFAGGQVNYGTSAATSFQRASIPTSFTNNILAGTIAALAFKNPLSASIGIGSNIIGGSATLNMDSSSVNFSGNTVQGALTVNNSYFPTTFTTASATFTVSVGAFIGVNTIYASGSNTTFTGAARTVSNSSIIGISNVISASFNGDLAQVNSTTILGQSMTIYGSNSRTTAATAADWGSAFVGRWNALNDNRAKTAETVFAVGTGTGADTRKTGFLIDSGSNTFVEGTLNVSGSTSMTGSLTIQSGSGDLFMYGHKMFNGGAFQSNVTQSGSANVSQSVNFDTTDVSYGVTLSDNSRLNIENAGTYLITFSAQVLADAGADVIYLWLKKNGTNVPESASKLNLQNNAAQLATVTFVVDAVANDYYEIAWQTTNGDAVLYTEAASGNIPAIPSIIATLTQVR